MELGTYLLAGGFLIIFAPLAIAIAMILKREQKIINKLESGSDCELETQSVENESGLTNKQMIYLEAVTTLGVKPKQDFTS